MTEAFRPLAQAQARTRGVDDAGLLVVAHPVGGLLPEELTARVDEAYAALLAAAG